MWKNEVPELGRAWHQIKIVGVINIIYFLEVAVVANINERE